MNWFKSVLSIAIQNFRKWKQDYRVWIAFLLVLIFIRSATKELSTICSYTGVKSTPWIFPFLYMPYYNKLLFFFPLILIFSNAPFLDKNQFYVLIRSGRSKWCIGQMVYIAVSSVVYFAFIMAFSVLLNLGCIEFRGEWGKLLNTLANTSMGYEYGLAFNAEKDVIELFTPGSAMWFTFLFSWTSGLILGLTVFLFNLRIKGVGTFLASFMLVFSAAAAKQTSLVAFSPVSFSTLNMIKLKPKENLPGYSYVVLLYAILIFILIAMILFVSKRYDFDREIKS